MLDYDDRKLFKIRFRDVSPAIDEDWFSPPLDNRHLSNSYTLQTNFYLRFRENFSRRGQEQDVLQQVRFESVQCSDATN